MKRILIIAAEASSDIHASNLIKSIRENYVGEIEFTGIGGERMLATKLFAPEFLNHEFAVCGGIGEIWSKLFYIYKAYKDIKKRARLRAYDLAIFLDYPEFNLKLAKYFTKISVPVIYYITPQVWAWRSYRVKKLKKYVQELVCVFDFEKTFFNLRNVEINFFGHPLIDELKNYTFDKNKILEKYKILKDEKVITLLPGSRVSEITNLMPEIIASLKIIKEKVNARFFLPIANTIEKASIEKYLIESEVKVELLLESTYEILSISDYAITASGTASLECALFKVPMTILYKVSSLSYFIFKYIIRYNKPFGLPNLIANRSLTTLAFSEFMQSSVNAKNIAQNVIKDILNNLNTDNYQKVFEQIEKAILINKSPSKDLASLISKYL